MANFFNFAATSRQITDPKGAGLDALKPIIESFENAVYNLKKSVVAFEQFELTFDELDPKKQAAATASAPQEVSLEKVNQKLFVDEFFALEPRGQILPEKVQHYDMRQMQKNDEFLKGLFKVPASILPL